MKIRHPFWIKLFALLFSWVIRLWIGTLQYRYRPLGANLSPRRPGLTGRYIYAFWHENLLLLAYHYGHPSIQVLISQHADGELIARVCHHLRFRTIRGSTTRGGMEALRQMLRASRACHIAVVPDGPKGPRRRLQLGAIYLASRTGLPIVAVGIGYDRPWRARSWDRFALPRLWTRACTVTSAPISVPPDLTREQLEDHRQHIQAVMDQVTSMAETWAETGQRPAAATAAMAENDAPGAAAA
jgi:lysophospholipid acyltransferase (LPLAT)-like uncharacterized protein